MMTRQTMAMQSNAGHQMMPGAQGAASHTLHQNDPRAQGMMGQQPHGDPQTSFDAATHASSAQHRRYIYTHDNTAQTFFLVNSLVFCILHSRMVNLDWKSTILNLSH